MSLVARERTAIANPYNGKLRDELLNGEIFYTLKEAKIVIEAWRRHYNTIRPHSSLRYRPPGTRGYLLAGLASRVTRRSASPLIGGTKCPHKLIFPLDHSVRAGHPITGCDRKLKVLIQLSMIAGHYEINAPESITCR